MKTTKIKFLLFFLLLANFCVLAGLSGTKTIGPDMSDDYSTISSAIVDLKNLGTNGHVKFLIKSGTYTERFIIQNFPKVNSTDTVLFVSETNNPQDVIIDSNATALLENYQLKFDGCSGVTFRAVKFKTTSNLYCNSVRFKNGASNNRIDNCIFDASTAVTSTGDSAKVIASAAVSAAENYNQVTNNYISGGGVGVAFIGQDINNCEQGNIVIGNTFKNQVYSSTEIFYNKNGRFEKNQINYNGSSVAATFYLDSLYEIVGNKIFCEGLATNGIYIMYHDYADAFGKDTLFIVNNMVSCLNGSALRAEQIKRAVIAHNTFYNESVTFYTLAVDQVDFTLSVNNLLVNKANNGAVRFTNDGLAVGSDYNGVFTGNGSIGLRDDGVKNNLIEWQGGDLNPDQNSFYGTISFDDPSKDLTPNCGTERDFIYNVNYIPELSKDINGVVRNPSGFWLGAAEFGFSDDHIVGFRGYVTNISDTLKNGTIEIYADTSTKALLDFMGEVNIASTGLFDIPIVRYTDGYWFKIIPDEDEAPNFVEAYHNGELRWDEGLPIVSSDSCGIHEEDIFPRKLAELADGPYSISGTVTETSGAGKVLGTDPIPGLDVVLDRIPPSKNTVAVTQTDENGNYSFNGLPEGIYVVTIDYEGLPADTIYKIDLGGEITDVEYQNYCVDTLSKIGGCHWGLASIDEETSFAVNVFPNPVDGLLNIVGVNGEFDYYLTDIKGRIILSERNIIGDIKIATDILISGVYILNVNQDGDKKSVKIVK